MKYITSTAGIWSMKTAPIDIQCLVFFSHQKNSLRFCIPHWS